MPSIWCAKKITLKIVGCFSMMEKWNKVDFSFLLNLNINRKCEIFITMKHRLFKYTLNVVLFSRNSIK